MKVTKITLEDKGQDVLMLFVNSNGVVIDAKPFQASVWAGAVVPIGVAGMVKVGAECPIHNPPHIVFGHLKYRVEAIETVEYDMSKNRHKTYTE